MTNYTKRREGCMYSKWTGTSEFKLSSRVYSPSLPKRIKAFFLNPLSLLLILTIALCAFLRFFNIANTPLWYVDEGTNLDIAWNLAHGRMQMFALSYPFVPHPPLSYVFSAVALEIFGYSLPVARMVNAVYGVITAVLLYYTGVALYNKKVGLLASFLFSIFPLAIQFNRMNFSYNLLQVFAVFTLLSCTFYFRTKNSKWFYGAAVGAGAASVTNPIGIGLILGLLVFVFIDRNIKSTVKLVSAALGVFALYPISMLALQSGAFLSDVEHYFLFHAAPVVASGSGLSFFSRATEIISYSPWFALGSIGLLMYPLFSRRKKEGILVLGLSICLFLFTAEFYSSNAPRFLVQLLPFAALGVSFVIWLVPETIIKFVQIKLSKYLISKRSTKLAVLGLWICVFSLVSVPLAQIAVYDGTSVFTGIHTSLDYQNTQSSADAYKMAEYVNSRVDPNDFVIASPHVAWLIHANISGLNIALSMDQREELRPSFTDDRYVFNCSVRNAKYLVFDNFTGSFYIAQPVYQEFLTDVLANWTSVYQQGEYIVFLNPAFNSTTREGADLP
ncbi:MAG: glycosyltransferase family 39 protein [Candidatus Bathyarchaeota archaeon]|nr:glycosyltransferase family 39 protein [Candidatus Bathyarchaeota archaeon]